MDKCDNCGKNAELYYNEATGLAFCDACDAVDGETETPLIVLATKHNKREQFILETTNLDPASLVESVIDPALFELADWPNTYQDCDIPCVPCAMCGHMCRWIVGFRHVDGDLIWVGEDCAHYLDSDNVIEKGMKQFKTKIANEKEKQERDRVWKERRADMVANELDVCDFLTATEEAEHAYREAEKPTKLKAPMPFLMDMVHAWNKWGSLTENQLKAVKKIMAKQAEWEAAKAAEVKPETPVAEGRYTIKGEVIKATFKDDGFNGKWVMTVKMDDGNKVWGTSPDSIIGAVGYGTNELIGKMVQFDAAVTRSDTDDNFGFYKKPTKGVIING